MIIFTCVGIMSEKCVPELFWRSINKLWLSEATLMMRIDMTALNVSRPLVWDVMSCTPLLPRSSEHELSMRLLYARIMIWNDIASWWWWDTLKSYIHPVRGNNGDIQGLTKYIFIWHILLYCYYASQVIKNACVYVFILSCKCHLQKTQTFNVHNFMTKLHAGSHCHYHEFFSLTMMTLACRRNIYTLPFCFKGLRQLISRENHPLTKFTKTFLFLLLLHMINSAAVNCTKCCGKK